MQSHRAAAWCCASSPRRRALWRAARRASPHTRSQRRGEGSSEFGSRGTGSGGRGARGRCRTWHPRGHPRRTPWRTQHAISTQRAISSKACNQWASACTLTGGRYQHAISGPQHALSPAAASEEDVSSTACNQWASACTLTGGRLRGGRQQYSMQSVGLSMHSHRRPPPRRTSAVQHAISGPQHALSPAAASEEDVSSTVGGVLEGDRVLQASMAHV